MPSKPSKPAKPSRTLRLRRRSQRHCLKPSCLCNRSLGDSLLEARDFRVVACSYGCKRPQFYFHETCASLYVKSLRACGFCKAPLISLNNSKNASLREALRNGRSVRKRRRLGPQVVALHVKL